MKLLELSHNFAATTLISVKFTFNADNLDRRNCTYFNVVPLFCLHEYIIVPLFEFSK